MASRKNQRKNRIKFLYREGTEELPEDEHLKRNSIMNVLIHRHGKSMADHSEEYTKLLQEYIENSRKTSQQKKEFKEAFFEVAIKTLILSFLLFAVMSIGFLFKDTRNEDISAWGGLVSSLVGLLSLYIIIPEIIAKYLFNVKEDENMAKIVESVQKYDAEIFASMSKSESENEFYKEEYVEEVKPIISNLKKEAEEREKNKI